MLMACSDGIVEAFDNAELFTIITENQKAENLCQFLVEKAFELGSKDNITLIVFKKP